MQFSVNSFLKKVTEQKTSYKNVTEMD